MSSAFGMVDFGRAEGDLGMFKRFWSISIVTCAVLLSSSTLVTADTLKTFCLTNEANELTGFLRVES